MILSGKNGLQLLYIGAGVVQVAEDVPAAANQLNLFVFHPSNSFNLFNRLSIRSTSCCGVLIPCVDFF